MLRMLGQYLMDYRQLVAGPGSGKLCGGSALLTFLHLSFFLPPRFFTQKQKPVAQHQIIGAPFNDKGTLLFVALWARRGRADGEVVPNRFGSLVLAFWNDTRLKRQL